MKHLFLLFAITSVVAFSFCACGGSNSKDKALIDKLDDAVNQMKEREDTRWKAVAEKLSKDTNLANQLLTFAPGKNFVFDSTQPVEVLVAKAYIDLYRNDTPPKPSSGPTSTLSVKRTESVWIDKRAILAFARTILTNDSIDGIRVYFAKYPANAPEVDAGLDASCNNRTTIIFTATGLMPDGRKHVDKFLPKPRGATKGPMDGLYVYDYNSLCPDSCSGGTLGGNP